MPTHALNSLVLCLLLSGCVLSGNQARNSRYNVDITSMEKATFFHDSWIYRHPTKKAVDYKAFIISPVTVYKNPAKKIKDRAPYEALARTLTDRFRLTMSRDYNLVETPGKNTLRIDIAVVDIKPIVKIKKGITDTIIVSGDIHGTKLEMDCFDSQSEEEIFAISTLYKGEEFQAYQDPFLVRNVDVAFDEWSAFLKDRFDEAMMKQRSP